MSDCEFSTKTGDTRRASTAFRKQIEGYGLTTAEILYRMPDHPGLLQTFLWQEYDRAPEYPVLLGFLAWWRREIEGVLHSVRVGHKALIGPADFRPVKAELLLN
ncbi:MAG: usg protein [Hansschlegelia sp.]